MLNMSHDNHIMKSSVFGNLKISISSRLSTGYTKQIKTFEKQLYIFRNYYKVNSEMIHLKEAELMLILNIFKTFYTQFESGSVCLCILLAYI